jgi:tetratricopeptide (TPR) repeat protein
MIAAVVLALTLAFTPVRAVPPAPPPAPAPQVVPIDPKLDEAQRTFQRGVELYRANDFASALVAFKRAYELKPSYKMLYNLGQVSYQRHEYANAVRYFRQYLDDGGAAISPERQLEVMGNISRLSRLVAGSDRVDDVSLPAPASASAPAPAPPRLDLRQALPEPPPPSSLASPLSILPSSSAAVLTAKPSPPAAQRSSRVPWKAWTLTGLLAAGAATTGVIAYRSKQELDSQLDMFPLDHNEVDFYNRRTRGFALATDGLLIGTSIMAAISLYLTLRDPD